MKGTVKQNTDHIANTERKAYYKQYARIYDIEIIEQTENTVKGQPRRRNYKGAPPRNVQRLRPPRWLEISLKLLLTAHAFLP